MSFQGLARSLALVRNGSNPREMSRFKPSRKNSLVIPHASKKASEKGLPRRRRYIEDLYPALSGGGYLHGDVHPLTGRLGPETPYTATTEPESTSGRPQFLFPSEKGGPDEEIVNQAPKKQPWFYKQERIGWRVRHGSKVRFELNSDIPPSVLSMFGNNIHLDVVQESSYKCKTTYGELATAVIREKVQVVSELTAQLLTNSAVDEAALRRMRIEVRRLRNALSAFADVVVMDNMPGVVKALNSMLKVLGKPRDLDALAKLLEKHGTRGLDKAATKSRRREVSRQRRNLNEVLTTSHKEREEALQVECWQAQAPPHARLTKGLCVSPRLTNPTACG
mmetsp:Transcript_27685/g.60491  ORF Transcript_27685/g.60491 Transcript_27685/m.60491 type:complete len:336 (-) Transcript_27685:1057-2064(-)